MTLSLLAWLPLGVLAQDIQGWRQRPSGRELTAPDYARPAPALPLEASPTQAGEPPLSTRERVFVRRFDLTGNTVFTIEELAAVTAPYENRTLTAEELQEARRQLTLYYVERGYLNSGAVIPDQRVEEGVVRIQIIEGRLSEVDVTGNTHLRADYVRDRLRPEPDAPLNVQELRERLQNRQWGGLPGRRVAAVDRPVRRKHHQRWPGRNRRCWLGSG
jgi:hemolysin activation/secretion protein